MTTKNLLVLITGASSGLGAEFCRQYHAKGYRIAAVARRADKLGAIVNALNALRPNSVEGLALDLQNGDDIARLVDFITSREVEILVNNAGRGSFGYFDKLQIDSELELVALNIEATMRLAHAVIPQMRARKSGIIISVSSIAGFQAIPFMATYAATKVFNLYHSLALREELRGTGVKVITLCPGPTATEFAVAAKIPGERMTLQSASASQVVADAIAGAERNRSILVPTLMAKLLSLCSRVLPRSVTTWATGIALRKAISCE